MESVGNMLGFIKMLEDGTKDGVSDGMVDGPSDGISVGKWLRDSEGFSDSNGSVPDGIWDGRSEGTCDGRPNGTPEEGLLLPDTIIVG